MDLTAPLSIDGQSVFRGVLVRSNRFITVAMRRSNNKILLRSVRDVSGSRSIFRKAGLRGIVSFLEIIFQGVEGAAYVAQVVLAERKKSAMLWIIFAMIAGFLLSAVVLSALPLWVLEAGFLSRNATLEGSWIAATLFESVLKTVFLAVFLFAAGNLDEIGDIFRYQTALLASISTMKKGLDLNVENAKEAAIRDPGTRSVFFLLVVFFSIFGLGLCDPIIRDVTLSFAPIDHVFVILIKIVLILFFSTLVYEYLHFFSRRASRASRLMLFPASMVLRLVIRKPSDVHCEVALAAVRQILRLEKGIPSPISQSRGEKKSLLEDPSAGLPGLSNEEEFEIVQLADLGQVRADSKDFKRPGSN